MHHALRENLYCCVANGQAAFLDLAADRYFCLQRDLDEAFRAALHLGSTAQMKQRHLQFLLNEDILVDTQEPKPFAPAIVIPNPRASAFELRDRISDRKMMLGATASHFLHTLPSRRTLAETVTAIKSRKARSKSSQPDAAILDSRISAFLKTSHLVSTQDQCLRSSVAFIHYLAKFDYHPSLVIGVRFRPFRAHAWVQDEALVLNNTVDEVGPFTPILVA